MFWKKARRMARSDRLAWLEQAYGQTDDVRNFGIWTGAPFRAVQPLAQAAPHILAQDERRHTVLWPALFAAWPSWHWGVQPTGDCTRWMQQHLLDVLLANLWASGKIRKPDALVAGESIYGFAKCELYNAYGYHGAGATGYDVAEACVKYGALYRLHYQADGQACDLREETEYSVSWGDRGRGVPDWLEPFAGQHRVQDRLSIRTPTEMGLLIQSGYRIADNKTAELAEWNYELLPLELSALQSADFNLELLGFSADELAKILDPGVKEGLTDPDEIPEPPDEPITKSGDLWILGDHRLLCGDAGKPEDVDRLLAGAAIQLVNTDPPYNVKVEPRSNNAIAAGNSSFTHYHHQQLDLARHPKKSKPTHRKLRAKDRPLENDFVSDEEFTRLLHAWFGDMARVLEPGRAFYVWGGYANLGNYPPVLAACNLYYSQGIVWDKQHPVLTRKDFLGCFELAFYGWRKGAAHQFFGPNNVPDLWHIKKISPQKMVHLTEKPVELAVRAIQYSSRPGENVLDLFGGSGSTLIACEQTGRKAFLMEIDPLYCDVIVQRFEQFSGKKAERKAASVE